MAPHEAGAPRLASHNLPLAAVRTKEGTPLPRSPLPLPVRAVCCFQRTTIHPPRPRRVDTGVARLWMMSVAQSREILVDWRLLAAAAAEEHHLPPQCLRSVPTTTRRHSRHAVHRWKALWRARLRQIWTSCCVAVVQQAALVVRPPSTTSDNHSHPLPPPQARSRQGDSHSSPDPQQQEGHR